VADKILGQVLCRECSYTWVSIADLRSEKNFYAVVNHNMEPLSNALPKLNLKEQLTSTLLEFHVGATYVFL